MQSLFKLDNKKQYNPIFTIKIDDFKLLPEFTPRIKIQRNFIKFFNIKKIRNL